jgi:hypothetical protein
MSGGSFEFSVLSCSSLWFLSSCGFFWILFWKKESLGLRAGIALVLLLLPKMEAVWRTGK